MSPRRGGAKRYASVLMITSSPELICGAIDGPETCGKRTKNAAIRGPRIASCSMRRPSERSCTNRTTEDDIRDYFKIFIWLSGQKIRNARPVKPACSPARGPVANVPPSCAKPHTCESSESLRLSPSIRKQFGGIVFGEVHCDWGGTLASDGSSARQPNPSFTEML